MYHYGNDGHHTFGNQIYTNTTWKHDIRCAEDTKIQTCFCSKKSEIFKHGLCKKLGDICLSPLIFSSAITGFRRKDNFDINFRKEQFQSKPLPNFRREVLLATLAKKSKAILNFYLSEHINFTHKKFDALSEKGLPCSPLAKLLPTTTK